MLNRARIRLVVIMLILSFGGARGQSGEEGLPSAAAESRGFAADALRGIGADASRSIPSLQALLVWRGDALVHEGYYHGGGRDSIYNVKSVTKSVLSAIAGAAYGRGLLGDLDRPVMELFPEYGAPRYTGPRVWHREHLLDQDSVRRSMTLRHLLTMTTGQEWSDSGLIAEAMVTAADPLRFAIELPIDDDPGETFNYSTAAAHIFAEALSRLVHADLVAFADSTLFAPTGMRLRRWDTDPLGHYSGGSEMYFTARDLVRFGALYLKRGMAGGRRVLPEEWIAISTGRQVELARRWTIPGVDGYGYYWWRRRAAGHLMYCAMGYGGQVVAVVPDLDLVVVALCSLGEENRGRSELPRIYGMIDRIARAAGRVKGR